MEDPIIMRRLMLIILTLGLVSGQDNNLKYLMTAPAVMPHPSNQTVCVYIMSPNFDASLVTSFTSATTSSLVFTPISKGDGQLHCDTFEVPPPENGAEEIATLGISITCEGLEQSEQKSVIIQRTRNGIFVQTDRAIYQPGEKVIIKAVDFTENLIAKNEVFTFVNITDGKGNIMKHWKNVQPNSGILELSYDLSSDVPLGDMKIIVNKPDVEADATISVDRRVLPKFDVTIDAPVEATIRQSNFNINMCGKYTHGKPVRGRMTGKICRDPISSPENICKPIDGETDVYGCYTIEVNTDQFRFKSSGYRNYIDVEAFLEEDGTGVERKVTMNIRITDVLAKVDFRESSAVYKLGLDYRGQMTLTGPDGLPIAYDDIELYVDGEKENIYTTDQNGIASFTLDSALLINDLINLEARYLPRQPFTASVEAEEIEPVYEDGYASLTQQYTRVVSQVKIRSEPHVLPCNERVNLWADYVLDPAEYTKQTIDFHYLVITSGKIVSSSSVRHTISANGGQKSFFPFPVMVTSDMSPAATIIIYVGLDSGDLIADSIRIPVTSCFPNTVSLQFSEEQTLPGSMVNLHISAYPDSLCNVRAVDKSVELLKSQKRSEETVNEFLKDWEMATAHYPTQVEELQKCPEGSSPDFVDSSEQPDMFGFFEKCGMKVMTNFLIRKPLDCKFTTTTVQPLTSDMPRMTLNEFGNDVAHAAGESFQVSLTLPTQDKVRKIFPSTWLMNTVPIGPTGELDYPLKTPDTITQWNADAFCTSTIGLGFSPQTYLRTFKPFSVEIILPYSIKQGETLVLKANVLNFMRKCMKVSATLYPSDDFQLEPCEGCSYTACLCNDPTYTFIWNIKPLTVGHINITIGSEVLSTDDLCDGQTPIVPAKGQSDIVQRRLIVESHGIPVENTRSLLLCAFESETISLDLPENVVLGSQTAQVTVTGDMMGKPLSNLNNLVQLPTGCGEQNMMLLAPVISVITYFSATGQLTNEIVEKANGFMESGYQNQLNYRLQDGSYSAFGSGDPSGSTWLTAFVGRNLHRAGYYITIDYKHVTEAMNWLKGQQQSNGCFKNVGRVFHQELQGGVDNEISLTAYVTSAFLEIQDQEYVEIIEKAKQCLESCTEPQSSTYTKAQCAYTYTLLGDTEKRAKLLEQLDQVAIKKDGKTHWSKNADVPEDDPLWSKPNSADVETTAYVLLALVSENVPSPTDLGAAVPTVNWLTSQQNANGGFATTQDTVVAMSALATYGSKTFVDENNPTVTITNDKGFNEDVTVDPEKQTEVHVVDLRDIPAEYNLEASGSGCAYVQITERYNILNPEPEGTFILEVSTSPIECPPHPVPTFNIEISVRLSNTSENENSNMALLLINLLSGFEPVDVNRLLIYDVVKRVESSGTDVTVYLEKIESTPIELFLEVQQQSEVQDLQPAVVSVKDYYETSRHREATYQSPCN